MSVKATRWAIDTLRDDPTIPKLGRTILLVLAGHANLSHVCDPGLPLLAAIAGCHRWNAYNAVKDLAARGLIDYRARPGDTHEYRLPVEAHLSTAPRADARGTEGGTPRVNDPDPTRWRAEPHALARSEGLEGLIEGRALTLDAARAIRDAAIREARAELGTVNL